jgi:DNA-binding CsgD family transcriptional regulator
MAAVPRSLDPPPPTPAGTSLLERAEEVARLTAAIDQLRAGSGDALAIEGPPGIGKTRLIAEVRQGARDAGALVLSATAAPLERGFAYGVARQLLEPTVDGHDVVLSGRAAAAAAALAGDALEPSDDRRPWPVLRALTSIVLELSERRPVLVAVDDAQWADVPSLRFLAHAARRANGSAILFVVGQRTGHQSALAGIPHEVLHPRPLSSRATATILGDKLSMAPDPAFCAAAHDACGGNPLLVHELGRALASRRVEPAAAQLDALRTVAPAAVATMVQTRLAWLTPDALRLAQAAAILGDRVPLTLAGRLAGLRARAVDAAASELQRADVLVAGTAIAFVHALVRDALYAGLGPAAGDDAHRRAAEILREAGLPAAPIAEHLLCTTPRTAPIPVDVLRTAAADAMAAGDGTAATAYLRRVLAEDPPDRLRALLDVAGAEARVDSPAAIAHLEEALPLIDGPVAYARTSMLLAALHPSFDPDAALHTAQRAIDRLGGSEPNLRAELLAIAGTAATLRPEGGLPSHLLEAMRAAAAGTGSGARMLACVLAHRALWTNATAATVAAYAEPAFDGDWAADGPNLSGGAQVIGLLALVMIDSPVAPWAIETWRGAAERTGSLPEHAAASMLGSTQALAHGDLADARARGEEAFEAVELLGVTGIAYAHAASTLAVAALEQGDLAAASAILDRAASADRDTGAIGLYGLLAVRAVVRAATGDIAGALRETLALGRRYDDLGGSSPALLPWRSRAALLAHALDDARAPSLALAEVELARAGGVPRALGRALTAAGTVAADQRLLEEAVEVLAQLPAPVDQARAGLAFGQALHRADRIDAARSVLRAALDRIAPCGATPLQDHLLAALVATGARPRRPAQRGWDALTAAERRVARLAADGRANRDIADELYLTPRTVEMHLSRSYHKLGIRSRAQLASVVPEARSIEDR